jgi:hypothetical protein
MVVFNHFNYENLICFLMRVEDILSYILNLILYNLIGNITIYGTTLQFIF